MLFANTAVQVSHGRGEIWGLEPSQNLHSKSQPHQLATRSNVAYWQMTFALILYTLINVSCLKVTTTYTMP